MRTLKAVSISISCGFVFMAPIAIAEDSEPTSETNSCAYDETRPISFTNWDSSDKARVQILGENCVNSTVLVRIEDSSGKVLFSHAAILYRLTVTRFDKLEEGDAHKIANLVWSSLGPTRTSELQPWAERKDIYDLYDEVPALGREDYETARASDKPYVCVQTYYEGADCYWFDVEWGQSQKLLDLAG